MINRPSTGMKVNMNNTSRLITNLDQSQISEIVDPGQVLLSEMHSEDFFDLDNMDDNGDDGFMHEINKKTMTGGPNGSNLTFIP